jgi:amino acid transporter
MGHFPAILATIAGYITVQLLAGPAEIAVASIVINNVFFPSLSPTFIGIVMLMLFMVLNLLGVDVFAKAEIVFTIIKIITIGVIGIIGVFAMGNPQIKYVAPSLGISDIFAFVALGVWLLIGTEFTCPLVEEAKNPRRDMPLAMILGLVFIHSPCGGCLCYSWKSGIILDRDHILFRHCGDHQYPFGGCPEDALRNGPRGPGSLDL